MASIINEVESVAAFVSPVFPGAKTSYQVVPVEPIANDLVVRYLSSENTTETGYHYRLNREYQIIYFTQNEFACMQKFEELERHVNDTLVIPLKNSERLLRLESFSFSQPFKTEAGTVTAIIGVLSVHLREARTQETSDKINSVGVTTYPGSDAATFGMIDGTATPSNPDDGFTFDDLENGSHIFGKKE